MPFAAHSTIIIPAGPTKALPPSSRISSRTRRRTPAATGAAQPVVDDDFGLDWVPRSPSSPVDPPPRVPRPRPPLSLAPGTSRVPAPVPTAPIPFNRVRAGPLSFPILGRSIPEPPPPRPYDRFGCSRRCCPTHSAFPQHVHFARRLGEGATGRAGILCRHPIHYFRPAIGPAHRSLSAFSLAPSPLLLGNSGAGWQRPPPYYRLGNCPPLVSVIQRCSLRPARRAAYLLGKEPLRCRICLPLPCVLGSCKPAVSTASCHLSTVRTLRML